MAQLTARQIAHARGLNVDNVSNSNLNDVPAPVAAGDFILRSPLPRIAGAVTVADVAYAVYLGKTTRAVTLEKVLFYVSTAGTSTQVAEVGFYSSPTAPNRAGQTLTKIVATGTLDDLTGTGVMGNTTAFSQACAAGVHLWAVLRTEMAGTEPTVYGLTADNANGAILSMTTAGALTADETLTGAIITASVAWQCPNLEAQIS